MKAVTQMAQARAGIITPAIRKVAEIEYRDAESIREEVAGKFRRVYPSLYRVSPAGRSGWSSAPQNAQDSCRVQTIFFRIAGMAWMGMTSCGA